MKYFPAYPYGGLEDITKARQLVTEFIETYNGSHMHSGINYVTPNQKYDGLDIDILKNRELIYQKAMNLNSQRWSMKNIRNFTPTESVTIGSTLNSKGDKVKVA